MPSFNPSLLWSPDLEALPSRRWIGSSHPSRRRIGIAHPSRRDLLFFLLVFPLSVVLFADMEAYVVIEVG